MTRINILVPDEADIRLFRIKNNASGLKYKGSDIFRVPSGVKVMISDDGNVWRVVEHTGEQVPMKFSV